jgi:hypothetical protein
LIKSEVEGHLPLIGLEAALLIEADIVLLAVKYDLIAGPGPGLLAKCLDHQFAQPPAPALIEYHDILDMSGAGQPPKKLPLDEEGASGDDAPCLLDHPDEVVLGQLFQALGELRLRGVARLRQLP